MESETLKHVSNFITLVFVTGICCLCFYACRNILQIVIRKGTNAYKILFEMYYQTMEKIVPNKTFVKSDEYFNIENVFNASKKNYSHYKSLDCTFVGLGVLGTFVGLSFALCAIDFNPAAGAGIAIDKINSLLSAMQTAFLTSVFGMGASLIYSYLFRKKIKGLNKRLYQICFELDKEHLITGDALELRQTISLESMGKNMGEIIGAQIVTQMKDTMTSLMSTVATTIQNQMNAAGNYLSESANKLSVSCERMSECTSSFNESLIEIRNTIESLSATTEELNNCHNLFHSDIEEINTAALQLKNGLVTASVTVSTIDDKLRVYTDGMQHLQTIVNTVNEATIRQSEQVKQMCEMQQGLDSSVGQKLLSVAEGANKLESCAMKMYESINSIGDLKPEIENIFNAIQKGLQDYVRILQNETNGLISSYTQEFTKACESINSTTQQMTDSVETSTTNLVKAVSTSADMIDKAANKMNLSNIE